MVTTVGSVGPDGSGASGRSPARIQIADLSIRFRAGAEAVQSVGLSVADGEFVAVIGPSGCGKTTVLNAIAGLLDPDEVQQEGTIRLDDKPVGATDGKARPGLGYVFQRDALLPWRTVLGNVELGLLIRGVPRAERESRARALMEMAGLAGFEHYYPHQISGGMRQRTSLIRTLAYEPTVILMDEPFGALDAQNRIILQDELLRIWERTRKTILFVTHDLAEAIVLAQRVVVMSKRPGRITRVFEIDLPTPRDPLELRGSRAFAELETTIWATLRDEFRADQRSAEGA
jgi:NitT/TauT family transport system ATP-binding protein